MVTLYSDDKSNYDIGVLPSPANIDRDSVNESVKESGKVSDVIQAQTTLLAERTRLIIYFLLAILIYILFSEK
jgi:hypothetical protein